MSAQVVAKEDDWTPESVKNRGILMLNEMLVLLGEDKALIGDDEKVELLGLGFMIKDKDAVAQAKYTVHAYSE